MRPGATLKLAAVPKKIVGLLRVMRLILAFELAASDNEAVASFRGVPVPALVTK